MARSAKEIVQNVTDEKGAKNVDSIADRDTLLKNIDKMTRLQEIYKKIDNLETLTDEERKEWQSLDKKDKMRVIDAYNGVNMNMREPTTFADLEAHTKDYSDLAPETSPKDLESEKVFNPSRADDSSMSIYDQLVTAVANLKTRGKSPSFIKAMLRAAPEYKAGDKVDVPEWGEGEITGSHPVDIDKVIDDLVGRELSPEEVERSKKLTKVSKYKETRLHNKRMAALPENQKQSEAEQARITEGYQNEVNPDISEGGKNALYADPKKAIDNGLIKMVENNINLLAGDSGDRDFAYRVIQEMQRNKDRGSEFNQSLSPQTLIEIAKRFPIVKRYENGNEVIDNPSKKIIDTLRKTFDHNQFGQINAILNMAHSKGNDALARLAREWERVKEATDTEKGTQETTARSVKPGTIMKRGGTAFDKAFAGGTEEDAAKKAYAQNIGAYDTDLIRQSIIKGMRGDKKNKKIPDDWTDEQVNAFVNYAEDLYKKMADSKEGEEVDVKRPEGWTDEQIKLGEEIANLVRQQRSAVNDIVNTADKPKHDEAFWIDMFKEHPDIRFHNQANMRTRNNNAMNITAIYKDETGKEVMEKYPLFGRDMLIFNDARHKYKADTGSMPPVKTEFTNLDTKNTDATLDSPRLQKWVDRYNRFFDVGDMDSYRDVFGDASMDRFYNRDENGFVTEHLRDPKKSTVSGIRVAPYFDQLAGILRGKNNLEDVNDSELYNLIKAQHGEGAAKKAKDLYYDISELNNAFGPVLSKDAINPSSLRSFASKFNRLRKLNPNMSLTDIFNKGDVSDVFGVEVHPKFGGSKLNRADLLRTAIKLADYKRNAAKSALQFDKLRDFLDEQGSIYQNLVSNPGSLPEGMSLEDAEDTLKRIKADRKFAGTPAEREAELRGMFVEDRNRDDLKSLADEAPEEYEDALANLEDANNELAAALELKKDGKLDFDVENTLRKNVSEARSKVDYLKNTKVDILKRAEELGKPYEEVLENYLHPDWDEDDTLLSIKKQLAGYDMMDAMKEAMGGNPHNSNVKANAIGEDFDVMASRDPSFKDWRDIVKNWSRPVAVSQLMSSPTTAGMIGITPEEWSAYNTNKGFFDSDTEQRRRNTTYYGQNKSAKGIAGADTRAVNNAAAALQYLDYTKDATHPADVKQREEIKQQLKDLEDKNKVSAKPYTRDQDIASRFYNAIKGVLSDRPSKDEDIDK